MKLRSTPVAHGLSLLRGGRWAVPVVAVLVLVPVTGASASISQTPHPTDITSTDRGESLLEATALRLAPAIAAGQIKGLDLSEYRVVNDLPGDPGATWVIPADVELPKITVTSDGLSVVEVVTPDPVSVHSGGGAAGRPGMSLTGTLTWQSAYCYSRYTEAMGWFDHCRQFGYIASDGDTSRDHWVLKQYGTCKSNSGWRMSLCSLSSVRASGTATQYWEDWAPTADSSGACRTISISVTAFGVGVSGSYNACETNDITKGAAAGSFGSAWKGSVASSERAVRSQIAVGVPQGQLPGFTLSWDINGYVNI